MIDFKKEIEKYNPVLEIDDIEDSIHSDEIQDIMDILIKMSERKINTDKE